jgi:hypothetical protein
MKLREAHWRLLTQREAQLQRGVGVSPEGSQNVAAGGPYLGLQLAGQVAAQELAAVRLRLAARHGGKDVWPRARKDSLRKQGRPSVSTECQDVNGSRDGVALLRQACPCGTAQGRATTGPMLAMAGTLWDRVTGKTITGSAQ